jgi:putative flippase GtrA
LSDLPRQLIRFGMVGTIGFVVDSMALLLLAQHFAIAPLPARVCSFVIAATVTWKLNRNYTFRKVASAAWREWAKYLLATAFGGACNVAVFKAWIWLTDETPHNLVIGVAVGSLAAMVLNFAIAKKVVFKNT